MGKILSLDDVLGMGKGGEKAPQSSSDLPMIAPPISGVEAPAPKSNRISLEDALRESQGSDFVPPVPARKPEPPPENSFYQRAVDFAKTYFPEPAEDAPAGTAGLFFQPPPEEVNAAGRAAKEGSEYGARVAGEANTQLPMAMETAALALVGKAAAEGRKISYEDAFNWLWQQQHEFEKENPGASILGRTAGLAIGAKGSNELMPPGTATGTWDAVKEGVKQGTALGALYGATTGETPLSERLLPTVSGMGIGAVLGGAAPLVTKAASSIGNGLWQLYDDFKQAFTVRGSPETQQKIVGKVLNEAAGPTRNDVIHSETPELLTGAKPTLGQATGNSRMLDLENMLVKDAGIPREAARAATEANREALTDAMERLGRPLTKEEASSILSNGIEAARQRMHAWAREPWQQINIDEQQVNPGSVLQAYDDAVGRLSPIHQELIPGNVTRQVATWRKAVPTEDPLAALGPIPGERVEPPRVLYRDVQAVKSSVLDAARAARGQGRDNEARVLSQVAETLDDHLQNPQSLGIGLDPNVYNEGVARWKVYKDTFEQPKNIRDVLRTDRFGADRVPESAVLDQFMKSTKGGPEAFNDWLAATRRSHVLKGAPEREPSEFDAMRGAFAQKLTDALAPATEGVTANISGLGRVAKFVNDYQHVINSPVFSPEQRQLVQRIANTADVLARKSSGAPTKEAADTVQQLMGDRYVDALVGSAAYPFKAATGLGAVALENAIAGPMANMAGLANNTQAALHSPGLVDIASFAGGWKAGDQMLKWIYAAPREKVMELLGQAITDPALAKSLMMKASPGATKMIAPEVKAQIARILGIEAGRMSADRNPGSPASP